jgi:hypothetical protein
MMELKIRLRMMPVKRLLMLHNSRGKLHLLERGGCAFGYKALQVQQAGAIGMICGDYEDDNYHDERWSIWLASEYPGGDDWCN